jgi:hypothetical protein
VYHPKPAMPEGTWVATGSEIGEVIGTVDVDTRTFRSALRDAKSPSE